MAEQAVELMTVDEFLLGTTAPTRVMNWRTA